MQCSCIHRRYATPLPETPQRCASLPPLLPKTPKTAHPRLDTRRTPTRGYLGAHIAACLTRELHLRWAATSCREATDSLTDLPISPQIPATLLGCQGPSRLNHTHHLAHLTWEDVAKLDAILLNGVRQIHRLPKSFPRVALQSPTRELGLNFPSIWEYYIASARATKCRIFSDTGTLGRATKKSLT